MAWKAISTARAQALSPAASASASPPRVSPCLMTARWLIGAGVLMQGGLMLFSWNLLARALLDFQALRSLVPVGGMALIAGWLVLAVAVNRTGGSPPGAG